MSDHFWDDAVGYLNHAADADAVARLGAVLTADAARREDFVALARLHAHLGEIGRRTAAGEVGTARLLAVTPPPLAILPSRPALRRRRWPGLTAAAAALLALGLAVLALAVVSSRTQSLVPTIAAVQGAVEVVRAGAARTAVDGARLRAGDRLVVGEGGMLTITLIGGRCELGPGSEAVVEAADELHRRVVLVAGRMSAELAGRDLFAVRTDAATISLRDAAAAIAVVGRSTEVTVSRGEVSVRTAAGERLTLAAGATWRGAAAKTPSAEVAAR